MTLAAEVTSRISDQLLVQITNPQNAGLTVVDTDRLGYACTDTEAEFVIFGAGEFDVTDAKHVAIAIDGVVAKLMQRTGHSSDEARTRQERFEAGLAALRQVQHADKVRPTAARTAARGTLVDRFPRAAIRETKPNTPNATSDDNTEP